VAPSGERPGAKKQAVSVKLSVYSCQFTVFSARRVALA
jgi:hypothetical protein